MRDNSGAAMELGDGAEVDRESQLDMLAFLQTQIRRLDEDARSAEIDGFAKSATTAGDRNVNGGSGSVPGVQAAFHGEGGLNRCSSSGERSLCLCAGACQYRLNLMVREIPAV